MKSLGKRCEQSLVAICGVVPASTIVPIFPSIVHIPALQREHYYTSTNNRKGRHIYLLSVSTSNSLVGANSRDALQQREGNQRTTKSNSGDRCAVLISGIHYDISWF